MQENASLKEQLEFSEKLEDIEKIQELLQEKDIKIKSLTDEISILLDIKILTLIPNRFDQRFTKESTKDTLFRYQENIK